MQIRNVDFYYGKLHALHSISLQVTANRVTALIGPSGCGKSTLIRTFNRMHETVRGTRLVGEILLDGEDIFAQDVTHLRRRIGMFCVTCRRRIVFVPVDVMSGCFSSLLRSAA